ncbi:response regulator [Oleiharenicola lentus]|uniref:response regulator n=1 Tax=Oleiharenicola lentus TaxID=2508720 RepID=UPI003F67B107
MRSATPSRSNLLKYSYLTPFGALMLAGVVVVIGWITGKVGLVQPRSYDPVLPVNAAVCLIFIGAMPIALATGLKRTSLVLSGLITVVSLVTLLEVMHVTEINIDDLLLNHDSLVSGRNIGRMPGMLAGFFTAIGCMFMWLALRPVAALRPLVLALLGSLGTAYGLAGLLSYRTGLTAIEFWKDYGSIGPHTASIMLVLGVALIILATYDNRYGADDSPRWLWLPMVVCSVTVTLTFWVALRERELAYKNESTRLNIETILTLFGGDSRTHVGSVVSMAKRWSKVNNPAEADWTSDAMDNLKSFPGYRSVQWVNAEFLRTKWIWPNKGNEDAPFYDHATDTLRRQAIEKARASKTFAIAAPIDSLLLRAPSFAVYAPIIQNDRITGFIVGEFDYKYFFDTIMARQGWSNRYQLTVSIANPMATGTQPKNLTVYELSGPNDFIDERLRQSRPIEIDNQDLSMQTGTMTLTPRGAASNSERLVNVAQLALYGGLCVSALFGLVVNLAQSARLRQRSAERTSEQLREENEERRKVEARLKATDERLNLALDSTQVGVYEWDVESDQFYCTPSVWKITGYDPSAMPATGQGWLNLLPESDQARVRSVIEAHFNGETPFIELEHCIPHQNGEWIWIALRAKCTSFSAAHRPLRVLGTLQNINARKLADEALRLSQAESRKLSLVASKTDNAVIITDELGRIEWVNESYSRLTGRRLADVATRPLVELLSNPEGTSDTVQRVSAALKQQEPVTLDIVQLAIANRKFHVHLDVQPVLNDLGGVENFIAIETDITSRVETEQQLRRAKSEADAASRAKSEFLASMSHEIRTPMNGVIGMTSLMLETDVTVEQRDYLNTIRTSGDALLSIINEILDFSKIESGKMELETQPFDLTQCVEEAIDIFALQAAAKNIELAYSIAPSVPRCIVGDITRLRQVLVNLINNAIKFTSKGFVTIEIAALPVDPANPLPDDKLKLDFRITDTGIGIPAERLSLLFKPFSQVDSSTTRKYGGTGLGLAICDRLCQLMGGRVAVESTAGKGSCFHFTITTSAVTFDANTPPSFKPLPGGRILVVDDHRVNRTALHDALASWNLTPVMATNVAEALALAEQSIFTAAIVDQNLDGVSAMDLVAKLRTLFPKMPVVLYTGASESARRGENPDAKTYRLPKPVKPFALHEVLRKTIGDPSDSVSASPIVPITAVRLADNIPLDILLVEDNLVNQKVAQRFLNRMGYTADCVANGLEAVQSALSHNYQLILMDVQMPEMDGYEATREIRAKLPPGQRPIIIALTANAMQGDRERCLEAGMDDYVTKPMKIDELQLTILRYFGNKAAV